MKLRAVLILALVVLVACKAGVQGQLAETDITTTTDGIGLTFGFAPTAVNAVMSCNDVDHDVVVQQVSDTEFLVVPTTPLPSLSECTMVVDADGVTKQYRVTTQCHAFYDDFSSERTIDASSDSIDAGGCQYVVNNNNLWDIPLDDWYEIAYGNSITARIVVDDVDGYFDEIEGFTDREPTNVTLPWMTRPFNIAGIAGEIQFHIIIKDQIAFADIPDDKGIGLTMIVGPAALTAGFAGQGDGAEPGEGFSIYSMWLTDFDGDSGSDTYCLAGDHLGGEGWHEDYIVDHGCVRDSMPHLIIKRHADEITWSSHIGVTGPGGVTFLSDALFTGEFPDMPDDLAMGAVFWMNYSGAYITMDAWKVTDGNGDVLPYDYIAVEEIE